MDCRPEPSARTLVRIECLSIMGFLYTLFKTAVSIASIPLLILTYPLIRMMEMRNRYGWVRRIALLPVWVLGGLWYACVAPFAVAMVSLQDIYAVAKAEWVNRWTASTPKKPNGNPLSRRSLQYDNILDSVIERSIIRDYGKYL